MVNSKTLDGTQLLVLLEKHTIENGYRFDGEPLHGWYDRSLSIKAIKANVPAWLQVRQSNIHCYENWEASNNVKHVKKPTLLYHSTHQHDEKPYSFSAYSYSSDKTVSPRAWQTEVFDPNDGWWQNLTDCLKNIQTTPTELVTITDELVARRLKESFDYLPDALPRRETLHGDLHWGNLGRDGTFYDWEGFGTGPYGFDIALLYFYSRPELRKKIETSFPSLFSEGDFHKTLLFTCAEILNMIPKYERLKPFENDAHTLSKLCLSKLS